MIQRLTGKDIEAVVGIHQSELHGFLTELGSAFLHKFYTASLTLPFMFTYVEKKEETVQGFVTGSTQMKDLYKTIILKDIIGFGWLFFKFAITHPSQCIKMAKTLSYPGFYENNPELLTIAIAQKYQGKGIGKMLFLKTVEEFKKRKCRSFKVSVYNSLSAVGFYKKMGCRLVGVFDFLGDKMSYFQYKLLS